MALIPIKLTLWPNGRLSRVSAILKAALSGNKILGHGRLYLGLTSRKEGFLFADVIKSSFCSAAGSGTSEGVGGGVPQTTRC